MPEQSSPLARGMVQRKQSDLEKVNKAIAHLLKLMQDPHYSEAFIRAKKKLPKAPAGRYPDKPGKLAKKLSNSEQENAPPRGRGRPPTRSSNSPTVMLAIFEKHNVSVIEGVRRVMRGLYPTVSDELIEKKAKEVAQAIRDLKKRDKKKSDKSA